MIYKNFILFALVSFGFSQIDDLAAGDSSRSAPDSSISHYETGRAVQNYRRFLNSLDNLDLNSIQAGIEQFQRAVTSDEAMADTLADLFTTFFVATIALHNDRMWEDLGFMEQLHADDSREDPALALFYHQIRSNGLAIYPFGRLYYVDQQPDYLLSNLGPELSRPSREYLRIRAAELREGFSENDSLVISFKQVGERVIRWERFLVRFPGSLVYDRAYYYYTTYLSTLLTGLARSPAFGTDGMLKPELVILYDDYSKRQSKTLSGQIIKEYNDTLVKGNFRWSPVVRDFYESHGIRNMHKEQVLIR